MADLFKSGQWLAACDRCGWTYYAKDIKKEYHTELMVCSKCWDPQHPQELIRPVQESTPAWFRPESELNISPQEYFDFGYFEVFDASHAPAEYINRLGI